MQPPLSRVIVLVDTMIGTLSPRHAPTRAFSSASEKPWRWQQSYLRARRSVAARLVEVQRSAEKGSERQVSAAGRASLEGGGEGSRKEDVLELVARVERQRVEEANHRQEAVEDNRVRVVRGLLARLAVLLDSRHGLRQP